ncbi:MAG: hypothetical protein OQK42_04290 [Sedimenticola sp.]|uniref:Uncharacterized protein n=1 Tax=Sedimenticola thiotaurini TaxID=1543721 RepID=A0A558DGP3_9GAMM|nr:hypothetical protein [Sedimenticola sp.]MCW9022166.1 hypothetical protein [Sedimenticola sp.]TVT60178.1 MAG: hypothetical protein FHK82_00255 [Sedimenticola thiotaurini]
MPVISYRAAFICCGVLALNATAVGQTAKQGSEAPKSQSAPTMQHQRGPKKLALLNADGAVITLWKPDLSKRLLEPKMDMVTIPPTGVDNYHAIIIEQDWGDSVDAIIRYEYLRGKPSGKSPTKLTSAIKTDLEIVPDPLPREHHRYYSGEKAAFLIRYRNQLLKNQPVVLQTGNGSSLKGVTDNDGRVVMTLPDDFKNVVTGERDQRSADLSITTEYLESGKHYNSTLSAEYRVSPVHWQYKSWGLAAAGVGFLFGGFLTSRVSRSKKERSQ